MGAKIFLAALKGYEKEGVKPKRLLESFFYLCGNSDRYMEFVKKEIKLENFLLDSGAFTFMNLKKQKNNFDKYVESYVDFIKKWDIKYFFELDVDNILGYKKVKEIRKYIERKTNKKSIPVWHKSRGLEEFKRLSTEYGFIAIGGLAIKHIKKSEYKYLNPLIKIAHKNGCKVHGLGFTPKDILGYDFDTTDSTSWKVPGRTGEIVKFNGEGIIKLRKPKNKSNKKIDTRIAIVHSLKEWNKYVDYIERS